MFLSGNLQRQSAAKLTKALVYARRLVYVGQSDDRMLVRQSGRPSDGAAHQKDAGWHQRGRQSQDVKRRSALADPCQALAREQLLTRDYFNSRAARSAQYI